MSRKFFGTDGIRGRAHEFPLTPEFVKKLGGVFGRFLVQQAGAGGATPSVVIGRDTRESGPELEAAFVTGLAAAGVHVIRAGILPTPGVAVLVRQLGAALGVVVSASHNPFHDNGLKFFGPDGYKFDDAFEAEIEAAALADEPGGNQGSAAAAPGEARLLQDAAERYIEFALATVPRPDLLTGLRIVLDNANGAACTTSETVLRRLGAEVIAIHSTPDGVNINADCGCTHPEALQAAVREQNRRSDRERGDAKFLVGIAHDGDADRVLLCDETGAILDGDELMALAAVHLLERGTLAKNTLVATVMSNWALNELIESRGGRVLRTAVGDRYVLEAMREHDLNVGGEQSGHFIFREHNTTGDGLVSALQFLAVVVEEGKPLSELRKVLEKYPQAQRNIAVREKPPLEELTDVQSLIAETESTLGSEGRTLLRYSGTEPKLRVLIEGKDAGYLERQADAIAAAIEARIGA